MPRPTIKSVAENDLLFQDGEVILRRGIDQLTRNPILTLSLASDHSSPATLERLSHEYAIRADLDRQWAAIPVALSGDRRKQQLVLADPGGAPLEALLGRPMPIPRFLDYAIGIATAVRQMHDSSVIHKDIKPANILVDSATSRAWLTGFGHASSNPREHQSPSAIDVIAGTFAYMAPEQTGRMNRSVDSRSDLYSLGIVFYRMLTGSLPFVATEPLEWIYFHIARQAVTPSTRVASIPMHLSVIVMKLLAKNAEERYQTAAGLEADLARCRDMWQRTGSIEPFALADDDISTRLLIPEKLYGRERESAALAAAFERVVQTGDPEVILVSGYSGIGKSVLVHELMKEIVAQRSLFVSSKYDQYKRDIPFATLALAFSNMIRQILTESEAQIADWRNAILEAVGRNGQVLIDLIPELEWVIGPQPEVIPLGTTEARNRFQAVFRKFIGVCGTAEHPLILFLDDMQWIDPASLGLLEHVATQRDVRHVLMIGAYRENEVSATHRLMLALEGLKKTRTVIHEISLQPLATDDVLHLIADAVRCDARKARPLAKLIYQKTGGNPFFTIQFLMSLAEDRLLSFDGAIRTWTWNLEAIGGLGYTDNVVDLMVVKLQRLPPTTLETLKQLACLGHSANLATLSLTCNTGKEEIAAALIDAVRAGFVSQSGDSYRFVHDRIQEASYSLIAPDSLSSLHLGIARVLTTGLSREQVDERAFEIVDHFNRAGTLVTDPDERRAVRELNVVAAKKAKAAIAYAAARSYLEQAAALLPADAWTTSNKSTFDLYLMLAECQFLTGNIEQADTWFDLVVKQADSDLDRAEALRLRVHSYQSVGRFSDALNVALSAMKLLGMSFPDTDAEIQAEFQREQQAFITGLGKRAIADLYDLPDATDATAVALMSLLGDAGAIAFNARPILTPLVYCKALNMALKHGNAEATCMTYISYGSFSVALGDIPGAFAFAELGLKLNERFNDIKRRGTLLYVQAGHINLWKRPLASGIPIHERGFLACQEVGNLVFACYNAALMMATMHEAGEQLGDAAHMARRYAGFAQENRNEIIYQWLRLYERLAENLRGNTPTTLSFDDDNFNEAHSLAIITKGNHTGGICNYHLTKQIAYVMHGRYADAFAAGNIGAVTLKAMRSTPVEAAHHFYLAVSAAALHASAPPEKQAELSDMLLQRQKMLAFWVEHCPENYRNRLSLISAEIARIEGRELDAMRLYDEAIRFAATDGFVQNEGLANELAANFYRGRGFETGALAYLRNARDCFQRWGANAVVARLERDNPALAEQDPAGTVIAGATKIEHLDLMTVLKASQAVSDNIQLDSLIQKLLTISVEHAGADRGLLILIDKDEHRIAAEAAATNDGVTVTMRRAAASATDLAELVLNYVIRTREKVLIDDVRAPHPFSADRYLAQLQPKSVLCLPLLRQGVLVGVLYLENHLTPGAFNSARTTVLELLASQAAISLENAILYTNLQREQDAIRELNASLEQRVVDRTVDLHHTLREQRAILDNALTGIAFIKDRVVLRCNAGFEKLFGFQSGELTGQSTRQLYQTVAEYDAVIDTDYATLRSKGDLFQEQQRSRKDGSKFWCTSHAKLIDRSDPSQGLVWVVQDITARKEIEQALQASLDQLAEKTRDLETARDNADRANRSKSEFLANMSHEIRTPINAITGFTALALRTELNPKQTDYLEKIHTATHGLLRIISDLLDFSKIEAGHLDMETIPFRLSDVMDTTVTYVGALAERKGLELLIHIDPEVPTQWMGDPLRIGQVLTNLCGNAVKFTEQGEIEVRVALQSQTSDKARLLFTVRDTGIGLTPAQSSKLFQAFTQADASTTRKFGGTGLGLVICRRLVEMMNGRIWLESQDGLGTTFFFEIELALDEQGIAPHRLELPAELIGQPALVVDDNANARQILSSQLAELGMKPFAVDSGAAALTELRKASAAGNSYPVVLMDWRMPGLDGIDTTRVIRSDPLIAGTPVIIMVTAYAREQVMSAANDPHLLDDILLKPITPGLLAEILCRTRTPDLPVNERRSSAARLERLTGVRILLVEDNPINQQLATELLEQDGATVRVASNGVIALDVLWETGIDYFDIVLLDLQMPEMDGYQAATKIRRIPGNERLPVIALTAHAMLEERTRCLAMGMQDHIAKPIDPELLVSKVVQWVGPANLASAKVRPKAVDQPKMTAGTLPNVIDGVDLQAALKRCGGDARLLRNLLGQFHKYYADATEQFQTLCAVGKFDDAYNLAHTIRGAAANLGMSEVTAQAATLEQTLHELISSGTGAAPSAGRLAGMRLLLVEDNPINQQLAQELLQQDGAEVQIAGNGRIALEQIQAHGIEYFNAALVDLQMPEMDGYETARQIRKLPSGDRIILIAMTGHAGSEERARCLAAGMQDHLTKPIDPDLMVTKLVKWIGAETIVRGYTGNATGAAGGAATQIAMTAALKKAMRQFDAAIQSVEHGLAALVPDAKK
jgi:PAS domain S-box-containing protein